MSGSPGAAGFAAMFHKMGTSSAQKRIGELCNIDAYLHAVHADVCVQKAQSAVLARLHVHCDHIGVVDGPHDMGASFEGMRTTSQRARTLLASTASSWLSHAKIRSRAALADLEKRATTRGA